MEGDCFKAGGSGGDVGWRWGFEFSRSVLIVPGRLTCGFIAGLLVALLWVRVVSSWDFLFWVKGFCVVNFGAFGFMVMVYPAPP